MFYIDPVSELAAWWLICGGVGWGVMIQQIVRGLNERYGGDSGV